MTAINSHVILPIARECARRDGDLWIIYMGNNEMVGPFGAGTVFGFARTGSMALVRAELALKIHAGGASCWITWRSDGVIVRPPRKHGAG